MNKSTIRLFLVLSLIVSVTLLFAGLITPAQAGKGAVKLGLYQRQLNDPDDQAGSGPKVGWAIANTNADGELIVQVHLDNGEPDQTFAVWIKVNGEHSGSGDVQLNTNSKGKGNAHVTVNLADYPSSTGTIGVQVVVKPEGVTAIIGYATAIEPVALKE